MSGCGEVVTFDFSLFNALYPAIARQIPPATAFAWWSVATQDYCDNTPISFIRDASPGGRRAGILMMITAHLVLLNVPLDGNDRTTLVGRISGAGEGSVSVQTDMNAAPGTAAWWNQTQPGASAYSAMAAYRTAAYIPAPQTSLGQQSYPWFLGSPNNGRRVG